MSSYSYGMGRRRRRTRRRHGGSILGSINDFLKKHRVISTVGSALGAVGVPYAGAIGTASRLLGYGRRRRVRRRRGGDLKSILSGVHTFVKNNRLISKGLRAALPNSNLHKAAHSLGYGRRRRVVRRRRGGDLKSILSGVHTFVKNNRLISKGLRAALPNSNLHKAAHSLGYGRRRRVVRRRRIVRRAPRHHGGANFFSIDQIACPKW